MIGAPKYYAPKKGNIMPVHLIESMDLNHHEGNIVKYICRYKGKNGLKDLLKARWCLNRLISQWRREHGGAKVQKRERVPNPSGTEARDSTRDTSS